VHSTFASPPTCTKIHLMRAIKKWISILCPATCVLIFCSSCGQPENATREKPKPPVATAEEPEDSSAILDERKRLDQTVWAPEVEAQRYEAAFVKFWDRERSARNNEKFTVFAEFPLRGKISFGTPSITETLEAGISLTSFQSEPSLTFNSTEWGEFVRSIQDSGVAIIQTEWHHSRFVPPTESSPPSSTIAFTIHAAREATHTRFAVKGDLQVIWVAAEEDGTPVEPVADSIAVKGLTLQERSDKGRFNEFKSIKHDRDESISAFPLLVYDLDNDGLSDIIIPRWNCVYRNLGERRFWRSRLFETPVPTPVPISETGVISDFNGDGNADLIIVGTDGSPYFCAGTRKGKFPDEPIVCADIKFNMPTATTAGDIDGDGDLDLWMTQYKLSFKDGQMPTPFYDANDGYPSFLLINDGTGKFTDATEDSGLSPLRNRRSYSASFIDLDADGDLDLINVSDYAGLDIYRNTGRGDFELATDSFVDDRHFFGMGHTFGDYNQDGLLDIYVIGMSSTTARRLDQLDLGRENRPDVHRMRAAMGYGNRLYYGTSEGKFREDPVVAAAVARTGWSWGATSFDFDLDGDQDIYVANGHRSGKSCEDYCSTFWRHDIYTGDSVAKPEILEVFNVTLGDLNRDQISWNGYEKNVLFLNQQDKPEPFINSSFMFGGALAFDARSVVSDDFDADGRPDLAIVDSAWNGRGFASTYHILGNDIDTGRPRNWFSVRLRESPGPGFSPNGAKVVITDDQHRVQTRWIVTGDSFVCQHAPVAHFGLGSATQVKSLAVTWPNGPTVEYDAGPAVNTSLTLRGRNVDR
jgi:hypothetical protein